MATYAAGVMPVVKTDDWRAFVQSAATGDKAEDHRTFLRRQGVTRENIFLQPTPMGDLMILVWEGVDAKQMSDSMAELMQNPQSDYERWLVDHVVVKMHGVDPSQGTPPPVEHLATIDT
jgi:hypothetical protein